MKRIALFALLSVALHFDVELRPLCQSRRTTTADDRVVVISPIYNEIIWALGAQDQVVGVDLSSTYPPEIKNVRPSAIIAP